MGSTWVNCPSAFCRLTFLSLGLLSMIRCKVRFRTSDLAIIRLTIGCLLHSISEWSITSVFLILVAITTARSVTWQKSHPKGTSSIEDNCIQYEHCHLVAFVTYITVGPVTNANMPQFLWTMKPSTPLYENSFCSPFNSFNRPHENVCSSWSCTIGV